MGACATPLAYAVCRFHRVSNVLPIPLADRANKRAVTRCDTARVPTIRSNLPTANIEFRRFVQIARRIGRNRCNRRGGRLIIRGKIRQRFPISPEPFSTAFSTETGFTVSAESTCRIKFVSGIDPDHSSLKLRRDLE